MSVYDAAYYSAYTANKTQESSMIHTLPPPHTLARRVVLHKLSGDGNIHFTLHPFPFPTGDKAPKYGSIKYEYGSWSKDLELIEDPHLIGLLVWMSQLPGVDVVWARPNQLILQHKQIVSDTTAISTLLPVLHDLTELWWGEQKIMGQDDYGPGEEELSS